MAVEPSFVFLLAGLDRNWQEVASLQDYAPFIWAIRVAQFSMSHLYHVALC